jgi:hypothetical protein
MIAQWSTLPEGDAGISATLARMRGLALDATRDPRIVQLARTIVAHVDGHDRWATTEAIFTWFADRYVYTLDPTDYELVVSPAVMLAQLAQSGYLQGDCDDASTLLAALLESVGVPTRFRVVGTPQAPGDSGFIHVLLEANTAPDLWLPLDVTLDNTTPGDRPPTMPAEAIYDASGLHVEGDAMIRTLGQFDFELPAIDSGVIAPSGGSSFPMPSSAFDLGPTPVIASPDISLGSQVTGGPVTGTMPTGGVTGTPDWTSIFADVSGAVVKVGSAALPLLERYGALTPVAGSVPLQYPGETAQQYAARVAAGGFQHTLATTPTSTWLLLGGGVVLLVLMLRKRR